MLLKLEEILSKKCVNALYFKHYYNFIQNTKYN